MRSTLCFATAAVLATSAAEAATTVFSDRLTFEAALSSFTVDTLDDITLGSDTTLVRDDYTLEGSFFKCVVLSNCSDNSGIGFNHPAYLWNYEPQTITFDSAINGFGLDFGNNTASLLTMTLGGETSAALSPGTAGFFGVISDTPFTQITYSLTQTEFALTDNFTYGTVSTTAPVPVPAAGWMLLVALGSVVGLRRKKR